MIRRLVGAVLVATVGMITIAVGLTAQQAPAREYIVRFSGPVLETWKSALATEGAVIDEYVPDFSFRVHMQPDSAARVRRLDFVADVAPVNPSGKLKPGLIRGQRRPYIVRFDSGRNAIVAANDAELDALARQDGVAAIENYLPVRKHNEFGGGVIMGANQALANGYDGSTQTIAIADTGLGNGTAAGAHADLPAARISSIFNWPGAPDECFDTIFNDGAVDVDTGHGTHVATAALGSGNATGIGRGTAPAATLVFQAIENYAVPSLLCSLIYGLPDGYYLTGLPVNLGDLFQQGYAQGARVHSDSWGSEAAGDYTAMSADADTFVWAHRDMTLTFSAGNSGTDNDFDGVVDLTSVNAPGTAKNVITVGASENDRQSHWECDTTLTYTTCAAQGGQNDIFTYGSAWPERFAENPLADDPSAGNAEQMAAFSSRGPTTDGRIKPDVVAPGTWTLSGYSDMFQQQYDPSANPRNGAFQYDGWGFPYDQTHKYLGGTSMAAPLVAGAAAVVRDFYQKAHSHQATAALVKATLINSAVDLLDENNDGVFDNYFPIPNMHEGWGRVDVAHATNGNAQFDDETTPLSTGSSATFTYPVVSVGLPLKVTLVWSDYPSSTSAAVNLVNDLDLTVTAPDGTLYRGNAFNGGWSTSGGSADRLNNVENVFLFAAAPGTWTVTVTGYNVPMGPQPFALVVEAAQSTGSALPAVRLLVDDATATEAGPTSGAFRFMRNGDTSGELTVSYTVGGTATGGSDYASLAGTVTFPSGASEVVLPVDALDDLAVEPAETVSVTIAADSAYSLGSPSSGVVTITSDDLPPDLTITSVTVPALGAVGGTITITDATRNQAASASPASETGFYLSTNTSLSSGDVFLGSRAVSALAGATTETQSNPFVIPETTTPGTYYVIAKADWSGAISETNENNNVRSSAAIKVGPDLIVSALTAPATAAAGETMNLAFTTKNQGGETSPASVTALFLSTNSTLDASDVSLGTRSVPSLGVNVVDAWSMTVMVPASTAVGSYYVLAQADSQAQVAESLENNNLKVSAVVRIGADLTVTALTAPTGAVAGDTIQVTDTTKNSGAADSPASDTLFYLSLNSALDASDPVIGSRSVPFLDSGAQDAATTPLVIPGGTAVGTYYVIAKADGTAEIAETMEANNTRVSGALKIGPDLSVTSVVTPVTGGAGLPISVTDVTRNIGTGLSAASETAFYLSANTSLDASDELLGTRSVPALNTNETSSEAVALTIPVSAGVGTYYVIAKADNAGVVTEVLETNNTRSSASIKVGPDLLVNTLTGPSVTTRGATIVVTDATLNQGGAPALSSTTAFYLSTNSTLDAADLLLGSRATGDLAAGASSSGPTSLTIPTTVATGNYYVIAKCDNGGTIVETLETNNTRTLVLKINP